MSQPQPSNSSSSSKPLPKVVSCSSCTGIAFHSIARRELKKSPLCIGLRRSMPEVTADTVKSIHEHTSQDFDKYVAIGYSVSSASMDRKGFHPVCLVGTQIKLVSSTDVDEDKETDTAATAPGRFTAKEGEQSVATSAASPLSLSAIMMVGVAKQWGALKKFGELTADKFPQKFYQSSRRLSRSCLKMAVRVSKEATRIFRVVWK